MLKDILYKGQASPGLQCTGNKLLCKCCTRLWPISGVILVLYLLLLLS